MREYELGQLLVNDILPEDMRDYNRVISKGTMGKLMTELAKKHPDKYKEVSHKLLQLGYQTAYLTNGDSFTLDDMAPTEISKKMQKELNNEVQNILYKAREKGIKSNDPKVTKAILDACVKWSQKSDEGTEAESDFDTNALFRQAQKGGVGAQKPGTYKSIRTGDVLYVDQNNKPVPIPVTHSYAQGLRPAEYFAGAFGTRKGIVDLQKATQDAGYLSKQLVQIAHRLVVDSNDSDQPYDEKNPIGYPSTVDDPDNEGAMLSMPVGGYKRNTVLTPKILADLKQKGVKNILVRSVIAGGPANGGIYAYDAGIRETGSLPAQGDFVGIKAVQAISEPITQSAISSKHSGGVAGAESGKAISGFKYINQLIQVPKHFQGGATHATIDGRVESIRPAAQGGNYITVNGVDHYVRTDQGTDVPVLVKVGDNVEAGDVMSDGIPNPALVVKYKGLGEGRRYFTDMFRDALDRAGTPINRRNIEVLSRGLISYVKLNDEVGDYAPDDVLPYTMIAADYQPRTGYVSKEPKACQGMYLEKPVLHYTIGTRITPSVIKQLNNYGITQITCHKDPPPFEPEMVRGMAHAANDPDWGTKMLGSYNKESLLESARLGAVSNTQGTSYVPALAFGDTNFGNTGATKQGGYDLLKAMAIAFGL